MSDSILQDIQALQFIDKPSAENLLKGFLQSTFDLDVASVELRPLAVSLNSFNGFATLRDGKRLFFKTHTEPDNVISEYYNAARLAEVGYPIVQPLLSSMEAGKQFLIYDVITDPSVFDVAWNIENGDDRLMTVLTQAQHSADDRLFQLYLHTLTVQSADDAAQAPVHQLFYHRLVHGRLERFYGNRIADSSLIRLPLGQYSMRHIRRVKWRINGQKYTDTLDDLIAQAIRLLNPAQDGVAIVGHGDAHNGNVFLRLNAEMPYLLYFDPAFAGTHNPLLDLAKPLFHNVFAMWMYFPQQKARQTPIALRIQDDYWDMEYDYPLHPVRQMFWQSKVQRVLIPILRELKQQGKLRVDWRVYLKSALFCCPFLTMNLSDEAKFPPEISLLGLAMSVEMGAASTGGRSFLDLALDQIAQSL